MGGWQLGSWGLAMDEWAELTGEVKEAATGSLDSEPDRFLEVLSATFCLSNTHSHLALGYKVVCSIVL